MKENNEDREIGRFWRKNESIYASRRELNFSKIKNLII